MRFTLSLLAIALLVGCSKEREDETRAHIELMNRQHLYGIYGTTDIVISPAIRGRYHVQKDGNVSLFTCYFERGCTKVR